MPLNSDYIPRTIFLYPNPKDSFEKYFTQPCKISYGEDTTVLQRFFSSFPTDRLLNREINKAYLTKEFIGQGIAADWLDKYLVQSLFDHCCYLVTSSIIYRACQLASLEVQHKITQSNLNPTTKLICTSLAISFPIFIVYLTGGAYGGILVSAAINFTFSYALPSMHANFFRTIDLISITPQFKPLNFIIQNTKMLLRYASIDFVILNKLLEPSLNNHHPIHYGIEGKLCKSIDTSLKILFTEPLSIFTFIERIGKHGFTRDSRDEVSLHHISMREDPSFFVLGGTSLPATLPVCFFCTCSYLLGKIVVDSIAILLNRKGIVRDLRTPLQPIFSHSISKIQQLLNYRRDHLKSNSSSSSIVPEEFKKRLWKEHLERNLEITANTTAEAATSSSAVPKTKKRTNKHDAIAEPSRSASSLEAASQTKNNVVPKKERESIQIPGYARSIEPLDNQGPENIWGIIVYDLKDRDPHTQDFLKAFHSSRHVSATSNISWMGRGKGKFEGKSAVYKIHPAGKLGHRLSGYAIKREENINNELQRYFPYELTLPIFEQMHYNGKPPSLIIFSEKTDHNGAEELYYK